MSTTVVVTGASAGVGRATVRAFAHQGASLALLARDSDGLDAAVKEVEAAGGRARAIMLDVADADAVDQAADEVEAELGSIDVCATGKEGSMTGARQEHRPAVRASVAIAGPRTDA